MYGYDDLPRAVGAACCSQFAVSRKHDCARSVAEQEGFWHRLVVTEEKRLLELEGDGSFMACSFGQEPVWRVE